MKCTANPNLLPMRSCLKFAVLLALSGLCHFGSARLAVAQEAAAPVSGLPDPLGPPQYNYAKTMDGGSWSSSAGIEIGPHNEVWAINRCDANSCENSDIAPIVELDMATGEPKKAIGAGLFVWPHGLAIDHQGNIWVTDAESSKDGTRGEQVIKLSPDGKVLMRLGTAGVAGGGPDHFNEPTDVALAPNGDIFVSDGHNGSARNSPPDFVTRIVKFSSTGKFIKQWGKLGTAPGEFQVPHALAFDRQGRLFVADRDNERIQIFDQNGKFIAAWKQFGRAVRSMDRQE
jgi:hypothetical protein